MDLRQLKYFVQISDSGNFSRAAEVLRIAQPSLSQQIKMLEEEGYALGSPENPLSSKDIQDKYLQLVGRECGEAVARESMDMILSLEALKDVGQITRLFAEPRAI